MLGSIDTKAPQTVYARERWTVNVMAGEAVSAASGGENVDKVSVYRYGSAAFEIYTRGCGETRRGDFQMSPAPGCEGHVMLAQQNG